MVKDEKLELKTISPTLHTHTTSLIFFLLEIIILKYKKEMYRYQNYPNFYTYVF